MTALPSPCLMLVTDRVLLGDRSLEHLVKEAIAGGVNAIQLREKDVSSRVLFDLAVKLRPIVRRPNILLLNDRIDVALAAQADGVELGYESIQTLLARRLWPHLLIGRSVHSVDEAVTAGEQGADFCIVGTMFSTRSHAGKEPEGPSLMTAARSAVPALPLIGIGGITPENAGLVVGAGATGIAVISDIMTAGDPRAAAVRLWQALEGR